MFLSVTISKSLGGRVLGKLLAIINQWYPNNSRIRPSLIREFVRDGVHNSAEKGRNAFLCRTLLKSGIEITLFGFVPFAVSGHTRKLFIVEGTDWTNAAIIRTLNLVNCIIIMFNYDFLEMRDNLTQFIKINYWR